MDVSQAEAFLVLAEELHFGRAANRLRISQPPLSRMIKQLEKQVGAELFVRSTRRVDLTIAGEALIEPAKRLVETSEDALRAVRNAALGGSGKISIGFAGPSTGNEVGELARELRYQTPELVIELYSSMFSHTALDKILNKNLDMAVGRWDTLPPEVDSLLIALEEVIAAIPLSHPLVNRTDVSMEEFASESWLTLPGDYSSALTRRFNDLTRDAGFVPKVIQTVPDSWTMLVLVGLGTGCAMTLSSVKQHSAYPKVAFKTLSDRRNEPLEVRLIWRRDNYDPTLRRAVAVAGSLFPQPPN